MVGRHIALVKEIHTQRLFRPKQAARYLGMHEDTLRKMTRERKIAAKWLSNRRVYLLEELDRFIESLDDYNPGEGAVSGTERGLDEKTNCSQKHS